VTLQQQIVEKFLAKLAESKEVDSARIENLRILLAAGKKPKAEDFVKIFSLTSSGDIE
jgi:hypothetical protein